MTNIELNYQQEAEEEQAQILDEELPFMSRQTRNLLIKDLKDIKKQLTIIEMKQKRLESIYATRKEIEQNELEGC